MTRKRKFCIDLTGRSPEEKDRIIGRIEQVIKAIDEEDPYGPEGPKTPETIDEDLAEEPEGIDDE